MQLQLGSVRDGAKDGNVVKKVTTVLSKEAQRADSWNSHKAGWDGLHLCSQHLMVRWEVEGRGGRDKIITWKLLG